MSSSLDNIDTPPPTSSLEGSGVPPVEGIEGVNMEDPGEVFRYSEQVVQDVSDHTRELISKHATRFEGTGFDEADVSKFKIISSELEQSVKNAGDSHLKSVQGVLESNFNPHDYEITPEGEGETWRKKDPTEGITAESLRKDLGMPPNPTPSVEQEQPKVEPEVDTTYRFNPDTGGWTVTDNRSSKESPQVSQPDSAPNPEAKVNQDAPPPKEEKQEAKKEASQESQPLPPLEGEWDKILGVSTNASLEEIKTAYRKLFFKYHPDARATENVSFEQKHEDFKKLQEAYEKAEAYVKNRPKKPKPDPKNPSTGSTSAKSKSSRTHNSTNTTGNTAPENGTQSSTEGKQETREQQDSNSNTHNSPGAGEEKKEDTTEKKENEDTDEKEKDTTQDQNPPKSEKNPEDKTEPEGGPPPTPEPEPVPEPEPEPAPEPAPTPESSTFDKRIPLEMQREMHPDNRNKLVKLGSKVLKFFKEKIWGVPVSAAKEFTADTVNKTLYNVESVQRMMTTPGRRIGMLYRSFQISREQSGGIIKKGLDNLMTEHQVLKETERAQKEAITQLDAEIIKMTEAEIKGEPWARAQKTSFIIERDKLQKQLDKTIDKARSLRTKYNASYDKMSQFETRRSTLANEVLNRVERNLGPFEEKMADLKKQEATLAQTIEAFNENIEKQQAVLNDIAAKIESNPFLRKALRPQEKIARQKLSQIQGLLEKVNIQDYHIKRKIQRIEERAQPWKDVKEKFTVQKNQKSKLERLEE